MLFQSFVKEQIPGCKVLEIDTTCMTPVEVLHQIENYIFSRFVDESLQKKKIKDSFEIKC